MVTVYIVDALHRFALLRLRRGYVAALINGVIVVAVAASVDARINNVRGDDENDEGSAKRHF